MLLAALLVATGATTVAAVVAVRRGARRRPGRRRTGASSWLSLPHPPRATTVDDDWVLEAFTPDEIAELAATDARVRAEFAQDHLALVLAAVPEGRRERRVRQVTWSLDPADDRNGTGRLVLLLADHTSVELDGVSEASALWVAYCHDQFGLVLDTIRPTESAWAAELRSCGWDTPLHATRLRVS